MRIHHSHWAEELAHSFSIIHFLDCNIRFLRNMNFEQTLQTITPRTFTGSKLEANRFEIHYLFAKTCTFQTHPLERAGDLGTTRVTNQNGLALQIIQIGFSLFRYRHLNFLLNKCAVRAKKTLASPDTLSSPDRINKVRQWNHLARTFVQDQRDKS